MSAASGDCDVDPLSSLDLGDSRIALLGTHAPALLAFVRFVRMGTPRGSVMNEQARLLLALVDGAGDSGSTGTNPATSPDIT
jgi:hypothetical protein